MAYVRKHKLMNDIGSAQSVDIEFGTRGGILLNLTLRHIPKTYFDIGSSTEQERIGPIHVVVGDSGTSQPILGQTLSGDNIIVRTGDIFEWDHPQRQALIDAGMTIEKLGFHAFQLMPTGVIRSHLRIIASWDPTLQVSHSLEVSAELLVFDSAVL